METNKFIIKKISAEDTRNLRHLILRPNQKPEELVYPGDDDHETVHFGLFADNELEGIASIYNEPMTGESNEYSWRLRGMATSEKYRGTGFGRELMNECITYIKSKTEKYSGVMQELQQKSFMKNSV